MGVTEENIAHLIPTRRSSHPSPFDEKPAAVAIGPAWLTIAEAGPCGNPAAGYPYIVAPAVAPFPVSRYPDRATPRRGPSLGTGTWRRTVRPPPRILSFCFDRKEHRQWCDGDTGQKCLEQESSRKYCPLIFASHDSTSGSPRGHSRIAVSIIDRVAADRACHAMATSASASKLGAHNRDHLDARLPQ